MCVHNIMEMKIGNRRLKMIGGKVCIVRFSNLGVEVKSGKFSPIKFSDHSKGYKKCCITLDGVRTQLLEHRIVYYAHNQDWDIFDGSLNNSIDHINRKKDDNSIENLHVVTSQQNQWNTDAKGYWWDKRGHKWRAEIYVDGKSIYLGMFENEEDAAAAYLEAKPKYHSIAALPAPGHASPTD